MKPDGTHTVEEICAIMDNELQSWERVKIGNKYCCADDMDDMDDIYENDVDISDFDNYDLIRELLDRGEEEYILDHLDIEEDIIPYLRNHDYIVKSI